MTSQQAARRNLAQTGQDARALAAAFTDLAQAISADPDTSAERKAHLLQEARTEARDRLNGIGHAAQQAGEALATWQAPPVPDAALGRAANRLARMLDNGETLDDALTLARTSGDAALAAACREYAPLAVRTAQRAGNPLEPFDADAEHRRLYELADRAAARSLTGNDRAEATASLVGRREQQLAKHEIATALQAIDGKSSSLKAAVERHYLAEHAAALQAELDG